jgi:hypothetical protein
MDNSALTTLIEMKKINLCKKSLCGGAIIAVVAVMGQLV